MTDTRSKERKELDEKYADPNELAMSPEELGDYNVRFIKKYRENTALEPDEIRDAVLRDMGKQIIPHKSTGTVS